MGFAVKKGSEKGSQKGLVVTARVSHKTRNPRKKKK